jgi:hypothetical protein
MRYLVMISVVAAVACSADATTIHVTCTGGNYLTIQEGVSAASSGDTVLVHCGVYYESEIAISEGIVLRSETGDPGCVIVDADGTSWIMRVSNLVEEVTIEGIHFRNGSSQGGAALDIPNASGAIRNCIFSECLSSTGNMYPGSAVYIGTGAFEIFDCTFSENTACYTGPSALVCHAADVTLTGCSFIANECLHDGGTIAIGGFGSSSCEMDHCTIAGNTTAGTGGGISITNQSTVTIRNSAIVDNVAELWGGGVNILLGGQLTAFDTVIRDNTADIGPDGYCGEPSTIMLICCDVVEDQWFRKLPQIEDSLN